MRGLRLRALAAMWLIGACTACLRPHAALVDSVASPPPCGRLIDAAGGAVSIGVAWHAPHDRATERAMSEACEMTGPGVYDPQPTNSRTPADEVVIASWNVHVGGGDLAAFVDRLRRGDLTEGHRVADFVLLLQEAFRGGGAVLDHVRPGLRVPARVQPDVRAGGRIDVVTSARALGLNMFYLPSMRNGPEEGTLSEDRGNAILSTRPLSDLAAIELPYERQRRVALAAIVTGMDTRGRTVRLRVVSAHLDARSSARHLWLLSSAIRERQAQFLGEALVDDGIATVVGADLNTWAGGTNEPAYRALRKQFPETPPHARASYRAGLVLDYLFFRLPSGWDVRASEAEDRFGSDHRPLISVIRVHG